MYVRGHTPASEWSTLSGGATWHCSGGMRAAGTMATKWTKEPGLCGPRGPRQTPPEAGNMETNTAGPGGWGMCGGVGVGWGGGLPATPFSSFCRTSARELHSENCCVCAHVRCTPLGHAHQVNGRELGRHPTTTASEPPGEVPSGLLPRCSLNHRAKPGSALPALSGSGLEAKTG